MISTTNARTIPDTILDQLGGNRFVAMTGAWNFVRGRDYLAFRIPAGMAKRRATGVRIALSPSDTYVVELHKLDVKRLEHRVLETRSDVLAANLRSVFTDLTGLDTHL